MPADIARLDLRLRRRSLIGYALGMALYALVVLAIYPTFRSSTGLDDLTKNDPTVAALFGVSGSLTSPTGWLNANLYANFVPLIVLLMTIGYGAWAFAGQNEDGTLCLVAALPTTRAGLLAQKFATLCLLTVPVTAATLLCVLAGRGFELEIGSWPLIGTSLGALLLGIAFGTAALLVGVASGSRGTALGVTSALAAASYLISSMAPVVDWIHPLRFASLFYWAVGGGQLEHGLSATSAAVLIGTTLVLLAATRALVPRLDVR